MAAAVALAGVSRATSSLCRSLPRHARCPHAVRPATATTRGRAPLRVRAAKDNDDAISGVIKTASGLVDKAADLVPESVPRSTAKAGVAIVGVMAVFWVLQKVISGVVTLAIFAGLGYYFLTQQGKDDVIDVPASKKPSSKGSNMDDPLSEARKIMDKYK